MLFVPTWNKQFCFTSLALATSPHCLGDSRSPSSSTGSVANFRVHKATEHPRVWPQHHPEPRECGYTGWSFIWKMLWCLSQFCSLSKSLRSSSFFLLPKIKKLLFYLIYWTPCHVPVQGDQLFNVIHFSFLHLWGVWTLWLIPVCVSLFTISP